MNRSRHHKPVAFGTAILLCALVYSAKVFGNAAEMPTTKVLTLGLVSATHEKEIEERFRDFVRYLARRVSSAADVEGKVVVAPTALQMVTLLEEKKVDFYMESAYPTYLINRQGAAVLRLRRWKRGMADYRSLLFTGKDNGTHRLEDFRGKMIAFEDRGSTAGYFLPKVFLLRKGLKLTEKPTLEAKVGSGEVGYFFASTSPAAVDLVLSKKLAGGAFSNDDYARLEDKKKAEIRVLAETESFPRHLVSTRKDLHPFVEKRLREVLLSMHEDAEGRKILQADDTTKFDLLPGGEETMRRKLVELFRRR